MFSVSLYERYSPFTASLYPRILGSVGSGRSNFIDKLAEPEGAKAPRPPIQVLHTIADWLGRNSAELQEAIESIQQLATGVPVWHLKHFYPGSAGLDRASSMGMDDTRSRLCWASWEWAWWEHGPEDRQRARDISCTRQDRGIVRSWRYRPIMPWAWSSSDDREDEVSL
ncbi:hypothetical protein PISMIDRAFT_18511 [Pisolithus microcarpus 441]|uniref:Uncharacterized protein n=1 Tax=Pisolithus microcarpus 441 TaxID=765257 RepID=A0A0C9YQW5_9AGAM|nr:hypothetical protein BKA83DRAFT_18511 [Pisolithus microcarpus]KIK12757.1 hypothetical protein PISMIDRAFT_18511 [Pisolithus microcarpus 441]